MLTASARQFAPKELIPKYLMEKCFVHDIFNLFCPPIPFWSQFCITLHGSALCTSVVLVLEVFWVSARRGMTVQQLTLQEQCIAVILLVRNHSRQGRPLKIRGVTTASSCNQKVRTPAFLAELYRRLAPILAS